MTDEAGTEEFPELDIGEPGESQEWTEERRAAQKATYLKNMADGRAKAKAAREARAAAGEPEPEPISTLPAPKRPKSAAPRRSRARVPLTSLLETTLGGVSTGLIMTGRDVPVGLAIGYEAPVAAEKLDAIIAGTLLDRLLQPLARAGAAAKDVGAILALPALVALIERRPYLYEPLKPLIIPVVTAVALDLAELQERNKERMAQAQARAGSAQVDVEALLNMLFQGQAPPGNQPQPEPQAAPVEVPVPA